MHPLLRRIQSDARRRRAAIGLALGVPWWLAALAIGWRLGGATGAAGFGLAGCAALAAWVAVRLRALDARWLERQLDASDAGLEDSSGLLLRAEHGLSPLQRLQRLRVEARLGGRARQDLREPWPFERVAAVATSALLLAAGVLSWPQGPDTPATATQARAQAQATAHTPVRLLQARLRVEPPAYTGLPARNLESLDARVPAGSRLRWRLRLAPQPPAAALVFHDGRTLALARTGGDWVADTVVQAPGLYRIVPVVPAAPAQATRGRAAGTGGMGGADAPRASTASGAGARRPPRMGLSSDRRYRIDVTADRPPLIQVSAPTQVLTLRRDGQAQWRLAFEALDDHGVAARAALRIVTARGSGEAVTFAESSRTLTGSGPPRRRRFAQTLDPGGFDLGPGDDLIVQFTVADTRPGVPQRTRSASYILRWPSQEATAGSAIDGLVKTVLPAYIRSQRQVIIDAEALLKARPGLDAEAFAARSDAIAVDQRLLRLRYGQFLGEETEGAPRRPLMPTNDAEDEAAARANAASARSPAADGGDALADEGHHDRGHGDEASGGAADAAHDHDHASAASAPAPVFGAEADVLEEFGHTHDHAEAATLLDPETRRTLKSALDAMWESELALRQATPAAALPPANRALALIKQVQQADRIYLARVGYEQVPVDEGRRLGGDRAGIARRPRDALVTARSPEAAPAALWRALQSPEFPDAALTAFEGWVARDGRGLRDPLALVAAVDTLRRSPACTRCRRDLQALLWPLLVPPPATPAPRQRGDAGGRAYLDALAEPPA